MDNDNPRWAVCYGGDEANENKPDIGCILQKKGRSRSSQSNAKSTQPVRVAFPPSIHVQDEEVNLCSSGDSVVIGNIERNWGMRPK